MCVETYTIQCTDLITDCHIVDAIITIDLLNIPEWNITLNSSSL